VRKTARLVVIVCAAAPGVLACAGDAEDTDLAGTFVWTEVDQREAPAEFPRNSGTVLVAGTLELEPTPDSTPDRFSMRFVRRDAATDSLRKDGPDGVFRVIGDDSIVFEPDAAAGRQLRFHYVWLPRGVLALSDEQGHVWSYVRQ
jgi:hypothetical protein